MKADLISFVSGQFPYFKNVALRSLPNRYKHLAEDLAQDAILKAIENLDKYDAAKGNFKSWLYRLTQNLCFDAIRKMDRTETIAIHYVVLHGEVLTSGHERSDMRRVRKLIKHLQERDRMLITYKLIFELSGREIAHLTGLPENQVNVYIQRAKQRLKLLAEQAA
jgi:RNA polymerase sigma-70 factor (ECF subfamily)